MNGDIVLYVFAISFQSELLQMKKILRNVSLKTFFNDNKQKNSSVIK